MIRNRHVVWTTIYIHGRPGAEAEILHNLKHSGFNFMPGYVNETGLMLFWVDEAESLRSLKKAIGARSIFKYRLQFYTSVEEYVESTRQNADALPGDQGVKQNTLWTPNLDSRDLLSA